MCYPAVSEKAGPAASLPFSYESLYCISIFFKTEAEPRKKSTIPKGKTFACMMVTGYF